MGFFTSSCERTLDHNSNLNEEIKSTSKLLNIATTKKGYATQPSWIYPRDARLVHIIKINQCNMPCD